MVGPVNERVYLGNHGAITSESYSLTILTTLDPSAPSPVVCDMRSETNTARDFFSFVVFLLDNNHLVHGDFLIVDNCSIHFAEEYREDLLAILDEAGVQLRFLPAYSPELNPCELVFSGVKNHLRHWRGGGRFWAEIFIALANVTYVNMIAWYKHCIN